MMFERKLDWWLHFVTFCFVIVLLGLCYIWWLHDPVVHSLFHRFIPILLVGLILDAGLMVYGFIRVYRSAEHKIDKLLHFCRKHGIPCEEFRIQQKDSHDVFYLRGKGQMTTLVMIKGKLSYK